MPLSHFPLRVEAAVAVCLPHRAETPVAVPGLVPPTLQQLPTFHFLPRTLTYTLLACSIPCSGENKLLLKGTNHNSEQNLRASVRAEAGLMDIGRYIGRVNEQSQESPDHFTCSFRSFHSLLFVKLSRYFVHNRTRWIIFLVVVHFRNSARYLA